MKILPLSPAPPPPGAPHREKTPPRNQVREEKRDHLLRREGGPGDDVLEPPECERISRFQPALDHFRVGKGEDTAGAGIAVSRIDRFQRSISLAWAISFKTAPRGTETPAPAISPARNSAEGTGMDVGADTPPTT